MSDSDGGSSLVGYEDEEPHLSLDEGDLAAESIQALTVPAPVGFHEPVAKRRKTVQPRVKKDPNRPKNAMTPYMFFAKEERPRIYVEHPGQEFKFYGRKLGERWHELSSEARQPFEAMAVADKKRFAAEFSSYQPAALYTQGKKLRKKDLDPDRPKKPLSGYMIFIQRARKQLLMDQPGLKVTDVSVELAGRWRAMAAEEKQPYLEEQARLKDAYDQAKAQYLAGKSD